MFDGLEFILRIGSGAHVRPANIDGNDRRHKHDYTVWLFLPGERYGIETRLVKKAHSNTLECASFF